MARRKRQKRFGELEPEQNRRLTQRLASQSFDAANEAIRLIRAQQCGAATTKMNEAAALNGRAAGHYANLDPDPWFEDVIDRSWKAVGASISKFRHLCLRPAKRRR